MRCASYHTEKSMREDRGFSFPLADPAGFFFCPCQLELNSGGADTTLLFSHIFRAAMICIPYRDFLLPPTRNGGCSKLSSSHLTLPLGKS